MKIIIFLFLPLFLYGENLRSLLEYAQKNNNLIKASAITTIAKAKELSSVKKSYFPTLDATTFYQRDDDATPFRAGTNYGTGIAVKWNAYDGGKRKFTIKQKNAEFRAQKYNYKEMTQDISLTIVQEFYTIKSLNALLNAKEDASKSVKKELERIKSFYAAQLATSDDVDRLQSAYDKNIYEIESLKLKILSAKKMLELKVGRTINSFDNSKFQKVKKSSTKELPSITALKFSSKSLHYASQQVESFYHPQIALEDDYNFYRYKDKPSDTIPIAFLDKQNTIKATLSMRLIDFGQLREQKEAIKLHSDALKERIIYKTKEQKIQLYLAEERIKTAKLNIQSAKSSLKAAQSAFVTITEKYKAGIVDNVTYLDALSNDTSAKALYEQSLNDLEVAYANYYYYQGKKLEELVQ